MAIDDNKNPITMIFVDFKAIPWRIKIIGKNRYIPPKRFLDCGIVESIPMNITINKPGSIADNIFFMIISPFCKKQFALVYKSLLNYNPFIYYI